jgi:hypothetical protein
MFLTIPGPERKIFTKKKKRNKKKSNMADERDIENRIKMK